jgi:hypothetical protein
MLTKEQFWSIVNSMVPPKTLESAGVSPDRDMSLCLTRLLSELPEEFNAETCHIPKEVTLLVSMLYGHSDDEGDIACPLLAILMGAKNIDDAQKLSARIRSFGREAARAMQDKSPEGESEKTVGRMLTESLDQLEQAELQELFKLAFPSEWQGMHTLHSVRREIFLHVVDRAIGQYTGEAKAILQQTRLKAELSWAQEDGKSLPS